MNNAHFPTSNSRRIGDKEINCLGSAGWGRDGRCGGSARNGKGKILIVKMMVMSQIQEARNRFCYLTFLLILSTR